MATNPDIQRAETKARQALAKLRIQATADHGSFPRTEDEWASLRKTAREIESACALRDGLRIIQETS